MASQKDMEPKQRGPWVFTLLDGLALEAVKHLTLEQLKKEDGDKEIWKILEERFPDKLQHDLLAECLKEVFSLAARDGESMAEWASRVQESFSKCRRKVSVDFPSEARGWVVLNCSGLSADQRAIVTAKSGGILKFETVVASLRSCFPDYVVKSKTKKVSPVMVVAHQDEVNDEPPPEMDAGDAVVFEEVEAFLSDHGIQHIDAEPGDFDETETAEILAATWKERRAEIAKLQRSRNFRQAVDVSAPSPKAAGRVRILRQAFFSVYGSNRSRERQRVRTHRTCRTRRSPPSLFTRIWNHRLWLWQDVDRSRDPQPDDAYVPSPGSDTACDASSGEPLRFWQQQGGAY